MVSVFAREWKRNFVLCFKTPYQQGGMRFIRRRTKFVPAASRLRSAPPHLVGREGDPLGNAPASLQSPPRACANSAQSGACQRRSACDFSHALSDAFALSCRSADSTEHGKAGHLQHHSGSCSPGRPRRPYYVAALLCVPPPTHQRSSSHAALHFERRLPFATCFLALARILTLHAR